MRVLVVYGSKRGGTAGLAETIGEALVAEGLTADVRSARMPGSPTDYDAVIVAGAEGDLRRLEPDAKGFPASAMAKKVSGDWRDPDQVREFASRVARSLGLSVA